MNCSHCGARLLETMIPATTPQALIDTCKRIRAKGAVGCLVSGGCLPDGSVPLRGFINAIAEARKMGLKVVVHSGLVDSETALGLKRAGVDAVSIDIVGSEETAREVYHVGATVEDYRQSLRALWSSGVPFTPHVLVGLHHGKLRGELDALRMIAESEPLALIVIAFFPIKGTKMEDVEPPSAEAVAEVLAEARSLMPSVPIALGCARPKGRLRSEMDILAVQSGVNAVAFPTVDGIEAAEKLGIETSFSGLCCSLVYVDAALWNGK